jgi:hypothetical protein
MGDVFSFFKLDVGFWILDSGYWILVFYASIEYPESNIQIREERELPDQMPVFKATDY